MHERPSHVSDEFLIKKKFSPRESEILRLAATGYDIPSIAEELGVTPPAINLYLKNIRKKTKTTGMKDRSTHVFMRRALELGVINKEDILESCNPDGFSLLKDREKEILSRVQKGLTHEEISKEIFISPRTIKNDMRSIREKTGLKGKHHVVAVAMVVPDEYLIPHRRNTEKIIFKK